MKTKTVPAADLSTKTLRATDYIDAPTDPTVTILLSERTAAGKLAEAELHWTTGLLAGVKLIGFAVWERRDGGYNVTFPARQYSVNGERRSFALLRPSSWTEAGADARDAVRDAILAAYHEAAAAA